MIQAWVLMENTADREDVLIEHGWSLYLETTNHKILFDMGQSTAFEINAQKLGIDLRQVDIAILSHGHYDHGGGLKRFLEINDKALVYMQKCVFEPHAHGRHKDIGLDASLQGNPRFHYVGDEEAIDEELHLYTANTWPCIQPINAQDLLYRKGDTWLREDFHHELYLMIQEEGRSILCSGCSHKGVINLMHWFHPDVLIGGFHLKQLDMDTKEGQEECAAVAAALKAYPTQYSHVIAPGHSPMHI